MENTLFGESRRCIYLVQTMGLKTRKWESEWDDSEVQIRVDYFL